MKTKICIDCKIEKPETESFFEKRKDTLKLRNQCRDCIKNKHKISSSKYYQKNKQNILEYSAKYYQENKEHVRERHRQYHHSTLDYQKERKRKYNKDNKEKVVAKQKAYEKERRKTSIVYKLRRDVSSSIARNLKKNGKSKNNKGCWQFLPYSKDELKQYLESKFELWMTWDNHGAYNFKTWDDNDSSTWTWNIDHIIPQSDLPYTSMEDENFKLCWSLNNLRPYSAKQNVLDGANRTRHAKNKIKVKP